MVTAKLIPNTCTRIHFITIKITRLETKISKSKTGVKLNSGLSPDLAFSFRFRSAKGSAKG